MSDFDKLVDKLYAIPTPALYEQLAEECTELGKAALKMARILRKENPTPVTFNEASKMIREELSDCFTVCVVLWSFVFGVVLGMIGMVLEGYFLYEYIRETEGIYKNQLRRRDEWIQCLEKELSRLQKERDGSTADAGRRNESQRRQAGARTHEKRG